MNYWYNYLVPSSSSNKKCLLLNCNLFQDNLIICKEQEYRKYKKFDNFVYFYQYFIKEKEENRCFYEVILASSNQKMYFDLDSDINHISLEESKIKVGIVTNLLCDYLNNLTSSSFNILVFSSNKNEKISYHIIVDGLYVSNYLCNKEICLNFLNSLDVGERNLFDLGMYKSTQQFRIYGNTKWKKDRYKIFENSLSINNKKEKIIFNEELKDIHSYNLCILGCSLITHVSECVFLPVIIKEKEKNNIYSNCDIIIQEEDFEKCKELYYSSFFPFTFERIIQNENDRGIITLKRQTPSFCEKCKRIHDTENAFFLIVGEEKKVYFDCRRSDGGLFLGYLNKKDIIIDNEDKEDNITKLMIKKFKKEEKIDRKKALKKIPI